MFVSLFPSSDRDQRGGGTRPWTKPEGAAEEPLVPEDEGEGVGARASLKAEGTPTPEAGGGGGSSHQPGFQP